MDDLVSAVDSVPNSVSDQAFLAVCIFGLSLFLALLVWLAPVRES